MVESCSTLPSLFVFADFSSSRIWRWTVFWKNDKIKRADYTKHQKSAEAWLSLQSDVLCNRLWKFKVGFCFVQLPPTEPKAWWSSSALPVHRYRVGWTDLLCLNMVEHLYSVVRNSRPVTSILYRRCSVSSRLSNGSINLKKYFSLIRNFKRQNLQTQK